MINNTRSNKNINIEILRILAMFFIIVGHSIGHTYLLDAIPNNSINYYLVSLLQIISYPATNIYVMISGYLLCTKNFKVKRLFTIWLQVFFYSILLMLVVCVFNRKYFSLVSLVKALMPISGNQYWFARVYIRLYLLMPFINKFISALNKKNHQAFLLVSLVLFSLWRSFIPFAKTLNSEGGNSIIWFIVLYCFGSYVKLYGFSEKFSRKKQLTYISGLLLFSFASRLAISALSKFVGLNGAGSSLFTEFTSFPILLVAWLVVNFAVKSPELFNRGYNFILWLSSSTYSVYLIHENQYVKKILWDFINMTNKAESQVIVLVIIGVAIVIFAICTILDKLLFVQVSRLFKCIKFEKAQAIVDSYLYEN